MRVKFVLLSLLAVLSLILSVFSSATPTIAQAPGDWTEYINDPVFGQWLGGAKAYYPKVIYDANSFSGHGDNAYYKMWFQSSSGIGYAYSNDGISWTDGANPLGRLVSGASHPLVKYDFNGFGGGIYYKIWYWIGIENYSINDLRYAESIDGINWTNDQAFTQDSSSPLVTGNSGPDWNAGSYGPCDIIYNQNGSNSLDDGNLWNNKYVLYYMGTNGDHEYIGLAYSNDAIHWKRYGNNPVLSPGATADWDNYSVGYCRVLKISGTWHVWYGGGPGTNLGIGYATSPDGINWTKEPDNPIFHKNDGKAWRDERTYTPWVLYDAATFGGHGDNCYFKMWFSGVTTDKKYSVCYAAVNLPLTLTATGNPNITIVGSPISFTSTPSGGVPPYVSYDWDFGDGSAHGNTQNPWHIYTKSGVHTVSVTVTDSIGNTATATVVITVAAPGPAPQSSAVGTGTMPQQPTSHGTGGVSTSPAPRPFLPVELPNLSVQSASLSATRVEPNTPVTLTALVGNKSTVNGTKAIKVYVNGQEETSTGVAVNSGDTRTVTFSVSRSQPGTYTVYVDSTPAGSFTVKDSTGTVMLVLSSMALLAAIVVLVYMIRRRQRQSYN